MKMVTSKDVSLTLEKLGITAGDTVLVHSSLRSLGQLENGADTVIRGFEDVIGKQGTLVMPTLCQVDFNNSYKTWYMDKPSDTGYLTEYFRKLPYVYRSDHATHSVAARGRNAYKLTCEHGAYGPHLCPYGEYAFADSSPWLKMYEMGAKTVFIGVSTMFNTMKHTVEARYMEDILFRVRDEQVRQELRSQVATFGHWTGKEIWSAYDAEKMQERLDAMGLVRHQPCGDTELLCMDMKQSCDAAYEILRSEPEKWCNEATMQWLARCKANF